LWLTDVRHVLEDVTAGKDSVGLTAMTGRFADLVKPDIVREVTTSPAISTKHGGAIVDDLMHELDSHLQWFAMKSFILELNASRVLGLLQGETSADRFRAFCALLNTTQGRAAFLSEYPVLARALACRARCWAGAVTHCLRAIGSDTVALRQPFGCGDPGSVRQISRGLGDSHAGGRTVRVVEFESGRKLVFKPRSLAAEIHFARLIEWAVDRGWSPEYEWHAMWTAEDRGWSEFVSYEPCAGDAAVGRFYERLGGLTLLLHLVCGTDVHYENMIARGEHPHLIDLESILSPKLKSAMRRPLHAAAPLSDTVLSVGVLPRIGEGWEERPGVDTSGIGGRPGQLFPRQTKIVDKPGTDEMHLANADRMTASNLNRPYEEGSRLDAYAFRDRFEAGFARMYDLALANKEELVSGPAGVGRFANDRVRVILKATAKYARLLGEGNHPDVLRDGMDREWLWDVLWKRPDPVLWRGVVEAEIRDLTSGDIPAFWSQPSSSILQDSADTPIGGLVEETGIQRAVRRIGQLSADDKRLQQWCVRAAFSTAQDSRRVPSHNECDRGEGLRSSCLRAVAIELGESLRTTVFRTPRGLSWTTLRSQPGAPLDPGWIGDDMYDGLPGVLLFLARLGVETADEAIGSLAKTLAEQLLRAPRSRFRGMGAGAFTGLGGIVYVLSHLGHLWRDAAYLDKADSLLPSLRRAIERDQHFDLMSGAAGAIMGLRAFHAMTDSPSALSVIEVAARRLVSAAVPLKAGCAWLLPEEERPIGGMSHGASGIAMALAVSWRLVGDDLLRRSALAACEYEDSLYLPRWANWADLREVSLEEARTSDHRGMVAWCHGAPGIGLARLCLADTLGEPRLLDAAQLALQSTIASGMKDESHCLCHGALGNIEFVRRMAARLDLSYVHDAADQALQRISGELREGPPVCGYRTSVPFAVPGLMVGMSGIGYACLQNMNEREVPSVLTLEPPPGRR